MKQPSLEELHDKVTRFNETIKIGDNVWYQDDFGKKHPTKTTSKAYVLYDHSSVVFIDGRTGCFESDRITKR